MRGCGIRAGIMKSERPSARLLDMSRLLSRAGRVLTGVDRVERAYLDALIASNVPAFGLIRTPLGFLLLDESGMQKLAAKIDGDVSWGPASRLAKVFSKLPPEFQRALTDARKLAVARCTRRGLRRMLKRHLPNRTAYFNTGHSNLTDYVTMVVKALRGGKIIVFVHDTIPLDLPHFQRDGSVERFKLFLGRVSAKADLVIYNSRATQTAAELQLAKIGRVPQGMVAHLGVDMAEPDKTARPKGLPFEEPYFLCVGTIEPRKNHLLLIDAWEQMEKQVPPQDMPQLLICGQRGWKNDECFSCQTRPLCALTRHGAVRRGYCRAWVTLRCLTLCCAKMNSRRIYRRLLCRWVWRMKQAYLRLRKTRLIHLLKSMTPKLKLWSLTLISATI